MSFNKPQRHVMSADRLTLISLTHSHLDLEQKIIDIKNRLVLQYNKYEGDQILSS